MPDDGADFQEAVTTPASSHLQPGAAEDDGERSSRTHENRFTKRRVVACSRRAQRSWLPAEDERSCKRSGGCGTVCKAQRRLTRRGRRHGTTDRDAGVEHYNRWLASRQRNPGQVEITIKTAFHEGNDAERLQRIANCRGSIRTQRRSRADRSPFDSVAAETAPPTTPDGSAAMMEARILRPSASSTAARFEFGLWGGEEEGLRGSGLVREHLATCRRCNCSRTCAVSAISIPKTAPDASRCRHRQPRGTSRSSSSGSGEKDLGRIALGPRQSSHEHGHRSRRHSASGHGERLEYTAHDHSTWRYAACGGRYGAASHVEAGCLRSGVRDERGRANRAPPEEAGRGSVVAW